MSKNISRYTPKSITKCIDIPNIGYITGKKDMCMKYCKRFIYNIKYIL